VLRRPVRPISAAPSLLTIFWCMVSTDIFLLIVFETVSLTTNKPAGNRG
jgi:hypothetical protein